MKNTVKLKDVAKRAGVGVGTASRVLNNHPYVSEEKKKKVMEAVEELGYQVNEVARSLKTKSSKTIAAVVLDILNPYYMRIVKGIESIANTKGYSIILIDLDWDSTDVVEKFKELQYKNVDGIVYMGSWVSSDELKKFSKINIPIALVSASTTNEIEGYREHFCSVNIDNEQAAYDAIKFLNESGYSHIACIGGVPEEMNTSVPRKAGVERAIQAFGVDMKDEDFIYGNFEFMGGYNAMVQFLDEKNRPEAVFCFNDEMAMGAIKAAFERGLKVPEDISVIGFDDLESSRFYNPGLTTIRQPRFTMGSIGAKLLIDLIEGNDVEQTQIVVEHKLVIRETHRA